MKAAPPTGPRASSRQRVCQCLFQLLILAGLSNLVGCGGGGGDGGADELPDAPEVVPHRIVDLNHGGFQLSFDCDERAALRFEYRLQTDVGNLPRSEEFEQDDPLVPVDCRQQLRSSSYAGVATGWDRGHLVSANHMDGSQEWMAASFYMTNILPQRSAFNQGLWQQTEEVAECYRDLAPVLVIGGVLFDDATNDLFLASHGVRTPDSFWKVLISTDAAGEPMAIAWLFPNRDGLSRLDDHLLRLSDLEVRVGAQTLRLPDLPSSVRNQLPGASWPLPSNCKLD